MEEAPSFKKMAEAPFPTLQPDALIQIFHKLPIPYLLQCKLVCKEWRALISDPSFKSNYNSSSIPSHLINLMMIPKQQNPTRFNSALKYDIDGFENRLVRHCQPLPGSHKPFESHNFTIMGSWKGLVALHHGSGDFYLLNPCTGEEVSVRVTALVLNTFGYKHLHGLSYDSSNGEYKAVLSVVDRYFTKLCVVSFKHKEWKFKCVCAPLDMGPWSSINTATVVNGIPHWIVSFNEICYFEHCEEEFRKTPKPEEWDRKVMFGLGALDGKLTVVLGNEVGNMIVGGLEVWVLSDFSNPESWTSLFVIVKKLRCVSPLSWINEEEVLMDVNAEELMIYNCKSRTIRRLNPKMKRKLYNIVTYVPTFVFPTIT